MTNIAFNDAQEKQIKDFEAVQGINYHPYGFYYLTRAQKLSIIDMHNAGKPVSECQALVGKIALQRWEDVKKWQYLGIGALAGVTIGVIGLMIYLR